jgi:protein arginine kinase activator
MMYCDECKMKPATVHITKIINNNKMELSLCEDCAKKYHYEFSLGFEPHFSIHKFFTDLLELDSFDKSLERNLLEQYKCDGCGTDYRMFQQTGKMGCANCYSTYGKKLDSLLRRVHGSDTHAGKYPKRAGSGLRIKNEVNDLKLQLQSLIAAEEFEKAAEVRDKIRDLETKLKGD